MVPLSILSAYIMDLAFGDPRWLLHPVRIMGRLIIFLEERLRRGQREYCLRIKGVVLAIIVVGGSAFVAYALLALLKRINPLLEVIAWIFFAYTSLAAGDLFLHARNILKEIKNRDVQAARRKLSLIVGRDTKDLPEEKIIAATIESIAENTNDGIVAPLFYLILGGPVLAIAYKAINTLDSMVGHKNEKYLYFGWFSAKLDDIANFLPARITGILLSISSFIAGKGFRSAFRIMLRDGRKHPSPNSGISESAMAGALGIRLGGPYAYQGEISHKPYLGEEKMPINPLLINEALKLSFITSLLMVSAGVILRWVI
jgi:adenosylcobinamide-phosphate synthase